MNSKEKRDKVMKETMKPLLKQAGYKCSGATWYSQREECYVVIHLQNSQWNMNVTGYHFWFNIDVLSTADIESIDEVKKWVNNFSMIHESNFLPKLGLLRECRDAMGYEIDGYRNYLPVDTNIKDFSNQIENDFITYILPKLKLIQTMKDWLQLKEDLHNSLNMKEINLLTYYSLANSLAIAESNIPILKEHMHSRNLSINEIKENLMMLKDVQRYAECVQENAEEFILKSLNS